MISSLHLHNFKCFEDQDFSLKSLTLLTGMNSTGKSSVLQSLLLLRQSYQEQLLSTIGLLLEGDLVNIGTSEDVFFDAAKDEEVGISILLEHATGIVQWRFIPEKDRNILKIINISSSFHKSVYDSSLFNDCFHYLGAKRISSREFFPTCYSEVLEHRQLGPKGEYTAHFLSVFGDHNISDKRLAHKDAASLCLKHQVEAWLGEISPGVRMSLTHRSDIEIVQVRYFSGSGAPASKDHCATNVGFGVTYVLPILVAILSSVPGTLLLIENPEAYLHPQGQAQMGELLARAASCGIQIVVETHSDHVFNGIRVVVHDGKLDPDDVQIHFFRRRERDSTIEITSPRIDHDGRFDKWPNGFFDEWEHNLMALLEPRWKE